MKGCLVAARPPWWAKYAAAVWLVPLTGDPSYTRINLIVLLAAYANKNTRGGVWAALLVNFVAINTSFHLSLLEDDTVFERFSKKFGVGKAVWHCLNFAAHVAPLAVLARERHRIRRTTAKERLLLAAGTSVMHLLWGARVSRGMDLSSVYVDLPGDSWKRLWAVAVLGHFAGAAVLP